MTAWALAGSILIRLNDAVLEKLSFSNVYLVDFHVFQVPDRCFLLGALAFTENPIDCPRIVLKHFELVHMIVQCMIQACCANSFALHPDE